MEIEGTVYAVLAPVSGQSARGNWVRQEMVIETKSGEFDRKLALTFWGDKTAQLANLQKGELVKVFFDLDSREFNGKWFTTAGAWKIERGMNVNNTPHFDTPPPMEEPDYNEPF